MLLKEKFDIKLTLNNNLTKEFLIEKAKRIQLYIWLYIRNFGSDTNLDIYYENYEIISTMILSYIRKKVKSQKK